MVPWLRIRRWWWWIVNCGVLIIIFFFSVNHLLLLPVTADFASLWAWTVSTEHIHTTNIQYRRHTCQYCIKRCKFRNIELCGLQTNRWNKKKVTILSRFSDFTGIEWRATTDWENAIYSLFDSIKWIFMFRVICCLLTVEVHTTLGMVAYCLITWKYIVELKTEWTKFLWAQLSLIVNSMNLVRFSYFHSTNARELNWHRVNDIPNSKMQTSFNLHFDIDSNCNICIMWCDNIYPLFSQLFSKGKIGWCAVRSRASAIWVHDFLLKINLTANMYKMFWHPILTALEHQLQIRRMHRIIQCKTICIFEVRNINLVYIVCDTQS